MSDFQNKVILAVGGAGYLSSPACKLFAEHGASVVITDIDQEKAKALAEEIAEEFPCPTLGLACDVGDETSVKNLIKETVQKFGKINVLINAAYKGSHGQPLEEMPFDAFEKAAQVQLSGTFLLARETAAVMPDGGNMIFFSSMYGRVSPDPSIYDRPLAPNPIDYGVMKAGLEQMIRYLAVHYAPRNIRVNGVAPGAFPHPGAIGYDEAAYKKLEEGLKKNCPLNRVGRQEELAGPLLFLASEGASFVTGHVLVVDGGWTIW